MRGVPIPPTVLSACTRLWGTRTISAPSLQVKLNKRYGYGLSFLMAYTYAHSIDDANAQTNAYDLRTARGPSSFDLRHRISVSPVYELPFGKGRSYVTTGWVSQIVGGWQISPLVQWQTGAPLTATLSGTYSNTGTTSGDRPNLIGDPNANAPHTPQQWFNTSVFPVSGRRLRHQGRSSVPCLFVWQQRRCGRDSQPRPCDR